MDEIIELSSEVLDILPSATILIKRGNSIPTSLDLLDGELGYSRGRKTLYIKDSSFNNIMIPVDQREEGKDYTGIIPIGSFTSNGDGGGNGGGSFSLDYTVSVSGMAPDAAAVRSLIGKLENLETTQKTNLVMAINEALNNARVEIDETLTKKGVAADAAAVGDAIDQAIEDLRADLTYKAIVISSFTVNPSWREVGDTPDEITLSWNLSKVPTTLEIDGTILTSQQKGSIVRTASVTDGTETFDANREWTISVTDERGANPNKNISITYKKPWYSGSALKPDGEEIYTSDFIKQFSDTTIVPDRTVKFGAYISQFNFNAIDGKYVYYCCPEGNTYTFKKGGMPFVMDKVGRVENYINQYEGELGPYIIYRTKYPDFQQSTAPVEVVIS